MGEHHLGQGRLGGEEAVRVRPGTTAVLVGGVVSSLAAYAFQILGARSLGDAAYAPVGILWTLQYLVLTIGLLSVEAHVTRRGGVSRGVWRWITALTVVVGTGVLAAGGHLFDAPSPAWAPTAAAIVVGFGLFAVVRGQAAARGDFLGYSLLTGGESVLRLLFAVVLLAIGAGAVGLAATLPAGAGVVALVWLGRRRLSALPPSGRGGGTLPFFAATTVANGIAQLLLASGPLVAAALGAGPAAITVVFVTTTAARAPLVFIHSGALARVLPPMRRMLAAGQHGRLRARVVRMALPAVALVVLAAVFGALTGPFLIALAFGADLRPPVVLAALTAVSVTLTMAALVLNQVAIAFEVQGRLLRPWLLGLLAGIAALWLAGPDPVTQVAVASAAGLAVATAGVLVTVLQHLGTSLRAPHPDA
ncbi:MAG TPA: hypothetical protein VMM13_02145 [Euzebya sp.]|nr:hypothetical protein [Euzebya sp.]